MHMWYVCIYHICSIYIWLQYERTEEKKNRRRFKSLFLLFRGQTWSLDQDSSSREVGEFETYQNVAIGYVRWRWETCGKWYESSLDRWVDGVAIYEEREQEKRRWIQRGSLTWCVCVTCRCPRGGWICGWNPAGRPRNWSQGIVSKTKCGPWIKL